MQFIAQIPFIIYTYIYVSARNICNHGSNHGCKINFWVKMNVTHILLRPTPTNNLPTNRTDNNNNKRGIQQPTHNLANLANNHGP